MTVLFFKVHASLLPLGSGSHGDGLSIDKKHSNSANAVSLTEQYELERPRYPDRKDERQGRKPAGEE